VPDDAPTDHELIDAINQGDEHAFALLYERYREWTLRLAWRFTGRRDLALDVVQEAFVYIVRKAPDLYLTGRFTTLLYPAVKHLSIRARQKAARLAGNDEVLARLPAADQTSPDDGLALDDLRQLLGGLSPDHREVVLMRFVDGLTLAEIAEAIDIPVGTVKSRLHHAIRTLRDDPKVAKFFGKA